MVVVTDPDTSESAELDSAVVANPDDSTVAELLSNPTGEGRVAVMY